MKNTSKLQSKSLVSFFPIFGWLPKYERSWLRFDLIAGLTVVALLIPEGMAYAQIAGMPPQTAFYALPFVLVGIVLMLLILLPVAKRMGARSEVVTGEAAP